MFSYNGTTAPSSRELVNIYRSYFNACVASGDLRPMVQPYYSYWLFILIGYLCIPHVNRPWLYAARWLVMALITVVNLNIIQTTSTMGIGTGFGVGLVAAWGIVWSATWLIWNAPQFDAQRVEVKDKRAWLNSIEGVIDEGDKSSANGKASKKVEGLRSRQTQNGHAKSQEQGKTVNANGKIKPLEYYWQPYPIDSFRDRIDWVVDLVLNFRGPGWNWEVPSNPPLPPYIKAGLKEPVDIRSLNNKSLAGIRRYYTRRQLAKHVLPRFIFGYLMLDFLKTILMKDVYFLLGPTEFPPPKYLESLSPVTLSLYRQLASMVGVITALETIFSLAPLIFCLILGPRWLGLRAEPWMYPTTWGSFDIIFKKGLEGLWGGWWHQTFRFAFASPANFLLQHKILRPKSPVAKLINLTVAFGISGFLHAAGSYTQFVDTKVWHPALFFMLQIIGILLQQFFCTFFKDWIKKMPSNIRTSANFAFTFTWLYCTSSLLIDDFARGGLWLFQPVPISLFRGLGYGEPGDGWWCWGGVEIWWQWGKHIWDTGLAS